MILDEFDVHPRSVRIKSQLADRSTLLTPGQREAVKQTINYCSVVDSSIASLESFLSKVENGYVFSRGERRRLQDVLNKHGKQRLPSEER
ncbi:hypothetical protein ACFQMA_11725 [Halosimplex aquaticum]|uniref:Uncharacterized protein n=1 Tax=Halosimplex aquaticum TaxID=3026162 RepID=A0ABD5Y410_9EURY|nr:hypothetical protein [Halosimplex aquaticum]